MYPISDKDLNKEDTEAVYFFTTAYSPLDNFSAHAISLWGFNFPTAEHAFQWNKFHENQPTIAETILHATSPHIVKEISDNNKNKQPIDWSEKKISVMEEIIRAKTEQHVDVQDILRKTRGRKIIENSPVDNFWGAGKDGQGQNMLGKIWMRIRSDFNLV
jgi:ribA/ribD-fused uncharacterized protein